MKNFFSFFLFLFTCSYSFAQMGDCPRFKNGKFMIYSEERGNSMLERKGSKQIETVEKTGEKIYLKVKWVDECTYLLTRTKKNETIIPGLVVKVQIIEGREKSYMARISSNIFSETMIVEIFKLDN